MTKSLQDEGGNKETTVATQSQESSSSKETSEKPSEATTEPKGEKRKREGDSPDREGGAQKVRAKSPIKEDEPAINNDNVQLNWCK